MKSVISSFMTCASTYHAMNMMQMAHIKNSKLECSKYKVCGVKSYRIQLHFENVKGTNGR